MIDWLDVKHHKPKSKGLHPVKTNLGEGVAFYVRNGKGDMVWFVGNEDIEVTHFKE